MRPVAKLGRERVILVLRVTTSADDVVGCWQITSGAICLGVETAGLDVRDRLGSRAGGGLREDVLADMM